MSMYDIYPLSRKLVFDTFDKKKYEITRTQQIILLSLSVAGVLNMSQLAEKINTSNEQATRAVAQLVDKGFIVRMQNPTNRRVINIMLTDEARLFLNKMKDEILGELVSRFSEISDEEMEQLYSSILNVSTILKKVMT
jgi:DNA-binding MarR family transcriptional regulator